MPKNESNRKTESENESDFTVEPEIVRLESSFRNAPLTSAERSRRWRLRRKVQGIKTRAQTPADRMKKYRMKRKQLSLKLAQCIEQASHEVLSNPTKQSRSIDSHMVSSNEHQDTESDVIQLPNTSRITQCNNVVNQGPHKLNIDPNSAAAVAIDQNVIDMKMICSRSIDRVLNIDIAIASIGDLCSVSCMTEDRKNIVIVAIHIFPNQTMYDVIRFIRKKLIIYTKEGTGLLTENLFKVPLILIGEFNISFVDEISHPLLEFLNNRLALQKISIDNLTELTDTSPTTIDGVFARYTHNIDVKSFISYYNYLEPIIRFSKCDQSDIIVTED